MEDKILKTIKKYKLIESGDKVLIAVSGGPDSMCLLDILNKLKEKLKIEIAVAHVNHGIRKEAGEETEYIKKYCEKYNIKIYIKYEDVTKLAKQDKIGLEEEGRKVRYGFFDEVLKETGFNKIAKAHNMNDKVETVLMNRPLIETERKDIEEYCNINKLEPKFDESNNDNTYTRNKVRNILIPFIKKEFNPNIIKGINNLSEIVTEEQNYLEKIVNNIYSQIKIEETKEKVILDLKEFNKQDTIIKKRLLLLSISKIFGTSKNIERIHIEDIIKLCERNIGNKYLTPNKNVKVFVNKGKIIISHTY